MKISEIFYGLQGEGPEMGQPAIFIRLSGCNLKCSFCDSRYADNGKSMTVIQVAQNLKKYGCKKVIITGGEPLLQAEELGKLVYLLVDDYELSIETNGTFYTSLPFHRIIVSPKKGLIIRPFLDRYAKRNNVYFKFVREFHVDNLWWESLIIRMNIPAKRVYIMAEGKTRKEQMERMQMVWEYCMKKGYNFSPRLHTLVYNNRRGV